MRRLTSDSIGGTYTAVILAFCSEGVRLCQITGCTIAQISTYPARTPAGHLDELNRCIQVHDPFQKYYTAPKMRAKIFDHYERRNLTAGR